VDNGGACLPVDGTRIRFADAIVPFGGYFGVVMEALKVIER